jgi:hypothetical protein
VRSPRSDKRGAGRSRRDTAGLTHKACRQRPSIVLCGEHPVAHLLQVVVRGIILCLCGVRGPYGLRRRRIFVVRGLACLHPAVKVMAVSPANERADSQTVSASAFTGARGTLW